LRGCECGLPHGRARSVVMKRPRATSSAADVAAAELPAEAAAAAGAAAAGDTSGENHAALPAAAGGAKPAKLRAPAALAWMRVPAPIDAARVIMLSDLAELDPRLQETLRASHIDRLFPVQAAVWDTLRSERREAHDICLNAPTGSGKTLAYALPVCAALSGRIIRRLRALVVLPTHDLAHQVRVAAVACRVLKCAPLASLLLRRRDGAPPRQVGAVFRPLCDAVGLSVAVASGKGTLAGEAAALVQQQGEHTESCVDVLVVTPGRCATLLWLPLCCTRRHRSCSARTLHVRRISLAGWSRTCRARRASPCNTCGIWWWTKRTACFARHIRCACED
jgi:hypothetical protein